jgi:hypothetical protein
LHAYEKTSVLNTVADSYPSVVRFIGHVQLKGGRPRTLEAYRMMIPCWPVTRRLPRSADLESAPAGWFSSWMDSPPLASIRGEKLSMKIKAAGLTANLRE